MLKNELKGWKTIELLWMFLATLTITSLSIYWKDTYLGIISSVTGVLCVICTAKGKLSAYVFGTINCALYAYIAYKAGFYGETMLNALYYLPLQFYGFYVWKKNMNEETNEVNKKSMGSKQKIWLFTVVIVATIIYGYILKLINGNLPFIDALSTVVSVVAMIISIKMYAEQWILWIVVDIVTVFMWGYTFFIQGSESIATLLMWAVYLLNAIFAYVKWNNETKNVQKGEMLCIK